MKRFITLLCAALLLITACACAPAAGPASPQTGTDGTADRTAPVSGTADGQNGSGTPTETDTTDGSGRTTEVAGASVYSYTTKEIPLSNQGQKIYGVAYLPEKAGKLPLVILSHGLGGSYTDCTEGAKVLAEHGVAAYCFDFRGGGARSRSEGDSARMSVMTEVSDLEAVLTAAKAWEFVDPEQIVLFGGSQGGIVSAIVAARHKNDVTGLILWFPAFVIPELVQSLFPLREQIPEQYTYGNFTLGRVYAQDVWGYDVYAEIVRYDKPVLIVHGTADFIVPVSYSRRAAEAYDDAELHEIAGAGHGFRGAAFDEATGYGIAYLKQIGILPAD